MEIFLKRKDFEMNIFITSKGIEAKSLFINME